MEYPGGCNTAVMRRSGFGLCFCRYGSQRSFPCICAAGDHAGTAIDDAGSTRNEAGPAQIYTPVSLYWGSNYAVVAGLPAYQARAAANYHANACYILWSHRYLAIRNGLCAAPALVVHISDATHVAVIPDNCPALYAEVYFCTVRHGKGYRSQRVFPADNDLVSADCVEKLPSSIIIRTRSK
mgnify:CR=1 FL=1